jgi:multisubunit Na+/H+ antiporter MnhB subunit
VLGRNPLWHGIVLLGSFATSVLLVATAGKLVFVVFFGPARQPKTHHRKREAGIPLWTSPCLLAVAALALGVGSLGHFTGDLVAATAASPGEPAHVSLLPPLGWPLVISLLALALGAFVYLRRDAVALAQRRLALLPTAADVWERIMAAIAGIGEAYSRRWQNGSLRWYLSATVLAVPTLCVYALARGGLSWRQVAADLADMPWYGFLFCALLAVATMAAVRARTRLAAAIATTTTGFLVSLLFVVYRSPDILLTQVLIETVSTIFVLLVLVFLPAFPRADLPPASRLVNGGIAAAFGLTISLLLLLAMTPGLREPDNISVRPGGLLSLALSEGGGQNAVNVIIVDIRAMDTTGEITVLVVVGLCIYGLLRSRRAAKVAKPKERSARAEPV